MKGPGALALALLLAGPAPAQQPPPGVEKGPVAQAADLVNALLAGLLGGGDVTGARLQEEVAEAGGVPFRRDVPVAFMGRSELAAYLRELFDEEYPPAVARSDERLLRAFDLLPPGIDLRALRARILEENVAGFYDERKDRRRLYTVSEDQTFSPMNQLVLAHELRHALQDQYAELDSFLGPEVSDFDDRQIAWISLLEGDATLVMERFVRLRLGPLAESASRGEAEASPPPAAALLDVPGAPPVVRDQLVQPYLAGLAFARALWERGGPTALQEAWGKPPESTEQVLHPAKYFSNERPVPVAPAVTPPPGARLLSEGVLGELLLRTLLEDGVERAADGWGGDRWRLWDVGGPTALAWRSEWDTPSDASEFHEALLRRFGRHRREQPRGDWQVFEDGSGRRFGVRRNGDAVELVSADAPAAFGALLGPGGR